MRTRTRRTFHVFGRLTIANWFWINFKVALGIIVPIAGFATIPIAVAQGFVEPFIFTLVLGLLIAGCFLSIIGIVMQANRVAPLQLGYGMELGGIIMTGMVPLVLSVVYTIMAAKGYDTWLGAAFTWALTCVLAARGVDIYFDQLENKPAPEGLSE